MFLKTIKELRKTNERLKKEKKELKTKIEEKDYNNMLLLKRNTTLLNAIDAIRVESQKNQYGSISNYRAKINKILADCKSNLASY